ncbi:unnamed protein product [Rangifer tarandus platyrhynchus]|uniref:Uncharacterized protein n=2 Tax=Rangifer tarandus platyrhynchus TaxID=3082113 RepID=A0ABN8Y833_RANTA|nr:unnamed protein product [Rangifer tarandus platyrhynchus]
MREGKRSREVYMVLLREPSACACLQLLGPGGTGRPVEVARDATCILLLLPPQTQDGAEGGSPVSGEPGPVCPSVRPPPGSRATPHGNIRHLARLQGRTGPFISTAPFPGCRREPDSNVIAQRTSVHVE